MIACLGGWGIAGLIQWTCSRLHSDSRCLSVACQGRASGCCQPGATCERSSITAPSSRFWVEVSQGTRVERICALAAMGAASCHTE